MLGVVLVEIFFVLALPDMSVIMSRVSLKVDDVWVYAHIHVCVCVCVVRVFSFTRPLFL